VLGPNEQQYTHPTAFHTNACAVAVCTARAAQARAAQARAAPGACSLGAGSLALAQAHLWCLVLGLPMRWPQQQLLTVARPVGGDTQPKVQNAQPQVAGADDHVLQGQVAVGDVLGVQVRQGWRGKPRGGGGQDRYNDCDDDQGTITT
jgi:hypothetical protein